MSQRAYCDLPHPGGDAEADDWCQRHHRPTLPRLLDEPPRCEHCAEGYHERCQDRRGEVTLPSSTMLGCQPRASYCCCHRG